MFSKWSASWMLYLHTVSVLKSLICVIHIHLRIFTPWKCDAFIYVLNVHNTIVPEHQFCGKIAHGGHCFVTIVTIFEKHSRNYVKTQQESSGTTHKLCSMLTVKAWLTSF